MKTPLIQLAVSIAVALIALGAYIFWYGFVTTLDSEAAALQSELAQKDAERSRSVRERSSEGDLLLQEAFVASHFVKTADIVVFLEQMERAGKDFGATVTVASVTDEAKTAEGRISLSLSVSGSFDAVMRTIGVIEHGVYATAVKDLSLSANGEGGTWNATGVFIVGTQAASTTQP